MMIVFEIWTIIMMLLFLYLVYKVIKTSYNDPMKWTNMEIIESSMYPGEKVIAFWNGLDLKDSFYIDEKGHPVNHVKD